MLMDTAESFQPTQECQISSHQGIIASYTAK
jgi:hypothetical protein